MHSSLCGLETPQPPLSLSLPAHKRGRRVHGLLSHSFLALIQFDSVICKTRPYLKDQSTKTYLMSLASRMGQGALLRRRTLFPFSSLLGAFFVQCWVLNQYFGHARQDVFPRCHIPSSFLFTPSDLFSVGFWCCPVIFTFGLFETVSWCNRGWPRIVT